MTTESDSELMVIGAGLGRTGTLSMQAALEMLGYNNCYHLKSNSPQKCRA